MSLNGWGMDAPGLHAAGGQIGDLEDEALAAGKAALAAVSDGEGAAHHALVVAALGRYHHTLATPAHRLAANVKAAGSNVQATACTGAGADADANHNLTRVGAQTCSAGTVISRPVNAR